MPLQHMLWRHLVHAFRPLAFGQITCVNAIILKTRPPATKLDRSNSRTHIILAITDAPPHSPPYTPFMIHPNALPPTIPLRGNGFPLLGNPIMQPANSRVFFLFLFPPQEEPVQPMLKNNNNNNNNPPSNSLS
ncbi:hypothetical protein BX600DRAFT_191109 [Xylariales sp. PMI_506]|nr:hypothetical protein BX600DRAFT_191109 [Xylariales sp. PMI_506]